MGVRLRGWQRMSKKNKKPLVPKLRFPEFKNFGGWEIKTLSSIAKRRTKRNNKNDIKRVLTNSAVNGILDQRDFFEKDIANQSNLENYFIVDIGDYVYNPRISTTALVGPISKNRVGKGVMSPLYTVFRFDSPQNDFYEQYFKTTYWHKYLYFISNSGARHDRMSISHDDFMNMPLPSPVPPEQKKIAICLSSLDKLIDTEVQKLDALQSLRKGLMQMLFPTEEETVPDLRFPEFRRMGGWDKKTFANLFTIGNGRDYKHLSKGDIPVYGSGGYMVSVNDYLYDGESVCIGRKGTINKPIFLSGKFWVVDTLFYTHSFINCIPRFIYLIFQNINWLKHNEAGGVPSLSKTNIEKIQVAIPSKPEQKKIADCLFSLDDLIIIQAKKIDALKDHKKGLLQGLFPSVDEVCV